LKKKTTTHATHLAAARHLPRPQSVDALACVAHAEGLGCACLCRRPGKEGSACASARAERRKKRRCEVFFFVCPRDA
jgi:hypothetical protein